MTYWKITLAYDGTPYRGWQVQPGLLTVQGLLADAIHRTVGERVLPQGSGRTDAGVHAHAQVASFALAAQIPAANLHRALNRCLPPSIRVLSVEAVPPEFHARHSARRKTYEYRIFPLKPSPTPSANAASNCHSEQSEESPHLARSERISLFRNETSTADLSAENKTATRSEERICPPMLAPFVWPCPWPLDLEALNQASRHVLGAHDFTSFAASDPDLTARTNPEPPCNLRTIDHSQWHTADGLYLYRVTANGFLHHMVRNLVGTFVQAGAHRLAPDSIPALLAACNRAVAGPTAPATGLFLVSVEYPAFEPSESITVCS
jgi:tRNA pseudouridine38-40 synthase